MSRNDCDTSVAFACAKLNNITQNNISYQCNSCIPTTVLTSVASTYKIIIQLLLHNLKDTNQHVCALQNPYTRSYLTKLIYT